MSQSPFRMELFGAPRVMRRGEEVRLPVKKSLALLAYLAIEGRATRAKLAGLFWGDSGDEAARRNLRRELHRLREAELADWLVAEGETVALAPQVRSDVAEFDEALALDERATALALWTGPLLDGFDLAESEEFERWLASRRDDFAHRFGAAARAHAREREAAGDLANALQLHARLIELDPLQESHYAAAMRLHYLAGDRGRAIDVFERCRAILQSELGLEPLPETAALAEHIRAAERVAPLAGAATTSGLAQLTPPLIGRAAELAQLAGGPVVTLICGEPGVGKTRLADEYTRGLLRRLRMAASELGRAAPLYPVAEALHRALEDDAQRETLLAIEPEQRRELLRLVPALDPDLSPPADDAAPVAMRARLIDAVATALIALADDGALWVDDVHWIDELTLEALHHLAHRLARERRNAPRIVLTARSQELADRPEAHGALLRLERAHLLQRIELAPLSADDTTDLVQRLSGAPGNVFAERLHRATRGNPFFLLETIRFLFDTGELSIDARGVWSTRYDDATSDYAELPVPPNVQQAVLERVERLGPATRRVLEAAALAGDGFTLDDVQPATALSEWEAMEGLERAAGASLISGVERSYRFGHDLVRLALDRNLGTERRRLIHLRLAETLVGKRGRADRIALHFDEAGHAAQAAPWHLAAARAAQSVFAWRDALSHTERALACIEDPAARFDVHRQRLSCATMLYDQPLMESEIQAMQRLVAAGLPPPAELEVLVSQAELDNLRKRHSAAADHAQAALAAASGLSPQLAFRARMELGFAFCELGRFDEGDSALLEVLNGEPPPTPSQRARALRVRANIARSRLKPELAAQYLTEAIAILSETGEIEARAHAYNLLAFTQHVRGQRETAIDTLELALADAQRAQSVAIQKTLLMNLVKLCTVAGDFPRAQLHLDTAAEVLRFADDPATLALLDSRRTELALQQGQLGTALNSARSSIAHYEANGGGSEDFWPWYLLARLLWHVGAREDAVAVFRDLPGSPAAAGRRIDDMVVLMSNALQLPAQAESVVAALDTLKSNAREELEPSEIDYWRAYALNAAGHHAEAAQLLDGLEPPQFVLHPASLAALRLSARTGCDAVTPEDIESAQQLLESAPPLEQLELLDSLVAESDRIGDATTGKNCRRVAVTLVRGLANSLEDSTLRAVLLRRTRHLMS